MALDINDHTRPQHGSRRQEKNSSSLNYIKTNMPDNEINFTPTRATVLTVSALFVPQRRQVSGWFSKSVSTGWPFSKTMPSGIYEKIISDKQHRKQDGIEKQI
jgi:hypothetical protein